MGRHSGVVKYWVIQWHCNVWKDTAAAFTPRKYSWYSFLLEAESTPGMQCGQKDYVNEKFP